MLLPHFGSVIELNISGRLERPRRSAVASKTVTIGDVTGPEGHWVVVVKGKVIASSLDVKEMLRIAEDYPEADTVVTKILYPRASFF